MGPIVCATRGGEASRRTQERAIALARERGASLIFLFVADTNFAQPSNATRAEEQGVSADMVVRHGAVRRAIEDFLREVQASTLVLGAPGTGSEKKTFSRGELPRFAQQINANTGVEVVVVE
jgi:nucleotide-binding universal stress UspA family protein